MTCRRLRVALVIATAATLLQGVSVHALSPDDEATQAAQAKARADAAARADQSQIDRLNQQLRETQQELARLQEQLVQLDRQISASQARIRELTERIAAHQKREEELSAQLARIARLNYQRRGAWIAEVVQSGDLVQLWGNLARVTIVSRQEHEVREQVKELRRQDTEAKHEVEGTLEQLNGQKAQAATVAALAQQRIDAIRRNREQLAIQLSADRSASARAAQAEAAALARRGLFSAVPGGTFSIDTDLRIVPNVDPNVLNAFLANTALRGLGPSFVSAGTQNHVNPLYLLAHAIEESAFGASQIAQTKHNLFGYGAIDSDPNQAMSYPSFDASIQFQARVVSANYLTPGGAFYHGPTLRGMNVCYASDPDWASKIAAIYHTLPGGNDPVPRA